MESFHWDGERHRPVGFTWRYGIKEYASCNRRVPPAPLRELLRRGNVTIGSGRLRRSLHGVSESPPTDGRAIVGPFAFAKGPLYFMSAELALQVVESSWIKQEVPALPARTAPVARG